MEILKESNKLDIVCNQCKKIIKQIEGTEWDIFHWDFCSEKCETEFRKKAGKPFKCPVCKKEYYTDEFKLREGKCECRHNLILHLKNTPETKAVLKCFKEINEVQ